MAGPRRGEASTPGDPSPPRYRKMKERLGLTEIRKQANRMSFGEVRPLLQASARHSRLLRAGAMPAQNHLWAALTWLPSCP